MKRSLSFLAALLSRLTGYGLAYVVLQIVTGIEVGVLAAGIAIAKGMTVPAALAATVIPVGVPLLCIQGAVVVAWREGFLVTHDAPV